MKTGKRQVMTKSKKPGYRGEKRTVPEFEGSGSRGGSGGNVPTAESEQGSAGLGGDKESPARKD